MKTTSEPLQGNNEQTSIASDVSYLTFHKRNIILIEFWGTFKLPCLALTGGNSYAHDGGEQF